MNRMRLHTGSPFGSSIWRSEMRCSLLKHSCSVPDESWAVASMRTPIVVSSLHRHSSDSSSSTSSCSSFMMHFSIMFALSCSCLYSAPMKRIVPSARLRMRFVCSSSSIFMSSVCSAVCSPASVRLSFSCCSFVLRLQSVRALRNSRDSFWVFSVSGSAATFGCMKDGFHAFEEDFNFTSSLMFRFTLIICPSVSSPPAIAPVRVDISFADSRPRYRLRFMGGRPPPDGLSIPLPSTDDGIGPPKPMLFMNDGSSELSCPLTAPAPPPPPPPPPRPPMCRAEDTNVPGLDLSSDLQTSGIVVGFSRPIAESFSDSSRSSEYFLRTPLTASSFSFSDVRRMRLPIDSPPVGVVGVAGSEALLLFPVAAVPPPPPSLLLSALSDGSVVPGSSSASPFAAAATGAVPFMDSFVTASATRSILLLLSSSWRFSATADWASVATSPLSVAMLERGP
uniref:Uncharacterized protein n=1 Tax=Anopheles merus TaxID=30066 RepID=A0A182VI19_ANOME